LGAPRRACCPSSTTRFAPCRAASARRIAAPKRCSPKLLPVLSLVLLRLRRLLPPPLLLPLPLWSLRRRLLMPKPPRLPPALVCAGASDDRAAFLATAPPQSNTSGWPGVAIWPAA
jgi:hypothetical protein